ncbi:16S rRNA (guanine(527)-N(7))-methyltransferase RsmG [Ureaplasma canigenitalium]|uniref:16S rRNA (guanine(527)-N(7))-methyltransferase RsmG n=1 Tax=Ureaplasma canigenitalium TaxID=42092 RepID=UPI0004E0B41C|nr:16S rRNA (guanine(527)-N(7))-methyltransferase RsmG [Ureaplasma canigenitalium]
MDKPLFISQIRNYFGEITDEQFSQIFRYVELVKEKNKDFNLTRLVSNLDDIFQAFLYDSLIPFKALREKFNLSKIGYKLLDIGSGNGIPGILLKIIFPALEAVLLESNVKKCDFLRTVINDLQLKDIEVWNMRAEDIKKEQRETFDIVTSRAVASLYKILEISAPFVRVNGLIICPKSIKFDEEMEDALNTIKVLQLSLVYLDQFNHYEQQHTVGYFTKTQKTEEKYPRTWAQIIKKPL